MKLTLQGFQKYSSTKLQTVNYGPITNKGREMFKLLTNKQTASDTIKSK